MAHPSRLLIVDDEKTLRELLARILELEGYSVLTASDAASATKLLARETFHVVITDIQMPGLSGLDLLGIIKQRSPATEVICLTAYGNVDDGVKAMKMGAYDYLEKSSYRTRIIPLLAKAVERAHLQVELFELRDKQARRGAWDSIIGRTASIQQAIALARQVAPTAAPVMLLGATGVGKEVFAKAIHFNSPRSNARLVSINCAALSRELLESELFGHKAGAFTGAIAERKGLFEEAHGGTLFLDEIGEMAGDLQAKLLRVLESGTYTRLGENTERTADVRILSATHRDLLVEAGAGRFREDLYYRLSMFQIRVPDLADRPADIPLLARHFMAQASAKTGKQITKLSPALDERLRLYPWRGNVRELKNVIERAVILASGDTLDIDLLPAELTAHQALDGANGQTLRDFERRHILEALERTGGNKTLAAKQLDIGLTTLYGKLREYGL